MNGRYYVKRVKPVMSQYNCVHAGVEVLSMSKQIMNRVFSCADDCDVKISYQDTDSIHLKCDEVDEVVER